MEIWRDEASSEPTSEGKPSKLEHALNTGMTRKVDELGRIVIPKEIRGVMGIAEKDPLQFFVDTDTNAIVLTKYQTGCIFCGNAENLLEYRGVKLCGVCREQARIATTYGRG